MARKISAIQKIQIGKWSSVWWVLLLGTMMIVPSTREVHKFLGSAGLVVYAMGVLVALGLLYKVIIHRFLELISESQAKWLVVLTIFALIVLVAIIFPIADSGRVSGGSDRDDALNAAVYELVHGRYPYTPEEYEGGPITPFPGAVFLAIPFVLIGNVAYQSVFWLGIAFIVIRLYLKDARMALLLIWTSLALSPVLLQQFVTGADLVSNALYLVVFMWLLSGSTDGISSWSRRGILASILLGIGLASRLNYLLLTPLILAMLVRGRGWKEGITHSFIIGVTFAAIVLPFYFYNKEGFSPLHSQDAASPRIPDIITDVFGFFPGDTTLVLGIPAIVLVAVLAWRFQGPGFRSLMINSAIVQFVLFMPFFILTTYQANPLVFAFSDFGIAYLIFGAMAIWPSLTRVSTMDGRWTTLHEDSRP